MKSLLLIRHAKSSWKNTEVNDHDRPLNKRGKRDLPRMLTRLTQQNIHVDACWSSTALRAKLTAEALAPAVTSSEIKFASDLYTFDPAVITKQIKTTPNDINHLAIVGHNPAIELLTHELIRGNPIEALAAPTDKFPTCAIALLTLNINAWGQLSRGCATLTYYDWPKRLKD